uniref:Uncharacterized protein n=2 Tax=Cucumis melo TaxID=3656 RepID=A0A9I9E1Q7_CUCME
MSAPTSVCLQSSDRRRRIFTNLVAVVMISHSRGACCTIHPFLHSTLSHQGIISSPLKKPPSSSSHVPSVGA